MSPELAPLRSLEGRAAPRTRVTPRSWRAPASPSSARCWRRCRVARRSAAPRVHPAPPPRRRASGRTTAAAPTPRSSSTSPRSRRRTSPACRWRGRIRSATTTSTSSIPIVVGTTMYVLAKNQSLVALDATTGKELWIHAGLRGIARRGINYWESPDGKDRRLIFQINNDLQAIDAATGKSILTFGNERRRRPARGHRPRSGARSAACSRPRPARSSRTCCCSARRPAKAISRRRARCAPTTSSPASWCGPSTPCRIRARRATRRGPRTPGSTSAAPTRGARSRSTRGAASPTSRPARRPTTTTAPIASAATSTRTRLIALDARTGKRRLALPGRAPRSVGLRPHGGAAAGHRQARAARRSTPSPWPPSTASCSSSIASPASRCGRSRSARSRRATMPGEQTWPTQPFPTRPAPFARQQMTVDDLTPFFLTDAERASWIERLKKAQERPVRAALDRARDDRRPRRRRRRQLGQHRRVPGQGAGLRDQPGLPVVLQAVGDAAEPRRRRRAARDRPPDQRGRSALRADRARPATAPIAPARRRRRRCSASARA